MADIKRILWIEDMPDNSARRLFPNAETKIVSTMDEAIDEISGKHLYDYDTIVLDIDFSNGLPRGEKNVLEKLTGKIYLSKEQKNKSFIIRNGGYLLFLYLLEKGYPSDRVAFLTGNSAIVDQLRSYTSLNIAQLSKKEIAEAFRKAWEDSEEDVVVFCELIDELPISEDYKNSVFVLDCAEALDCGDHAKLETMIDQIVPKIVTGDLENTADKMIFRFHEANLESPAYFSKNENDIAGHNRIDAERWIETRRTGDKVSRWLLLDAANYLEQLYRRDDAGMNAQACELFQKEGEGVDPGIRSAFRQLFYTFDGRIDTERRNVYYQAISTMLVPFDTDVKNNGQSAAAAHFDYVKIRRTFARVSKQARNCFFHNKFGSSISNETVLFVFAVSFLGLLTKEQAHEREIWFESMYQAVKTGAAYSESENLEKVNAFCRDLLNEKAVDTYNAHVGDDFELFTSLDLLRALCFNNKMSVSEEPNAKVRERYYRFALAAYIIRWFDGLSEEEIRNRCGKSVEILYRLSGEIAASYLGSAN